MLKKTYNVRILFDSLLSDFLFIVFFQLVTVITNSALKGKKVGSTIKGIFKGKNTFVSNTMFTLAFADLHRELWSSIALIWQPVHDEHPFYTCRTLQALHPAPLKGQNADCCCINTASPCVSLVISRLR